MVFMLLLETVPLVTRIFLTDNLDVLHFAKLLGV